MQNQNLTVKSVCPLWLVSPVCPVCPDCPGCPVCPNDPESHVDHKYPDNHDDHDNHDHEDPDHPNHSNNDASVMYWAIESQDIANQIDGELPNNFDSDDLDDLRLMKEGKL